MSIFARAPPFSDRIAPKRVWTTRRRARDPQPRRLPGATDLCEEARAGRGRLIDPRGEAYGFLPQLIGQTSLVKVDYDAKGRVAVIDPDEQDEYAEAAGAALARQGRRPAGTAAQRGSPGRARGVLGVHLRAPWWSSMIWSSPRTSRDFWTWPPNTNCR
jgi:hypothetical protein